ncbi:epoxide hydrolase [Marmoricola sp. Leaf446]|nr:epoxide hydrolase [Marmoricola sp. Leaf446]
MVPFTVEVPEAEVEDLRERVRRTRWPAPAPGETVAGQEWSRGVPVGYLRELAAYWSEEFDWRTHEAQLNALPQLTTTIDGARVHLVHERSPEPDALPLVMTHGWPGSVLEFLDVVGPLTDPVAHGGDARDAFHVVAPSIPGYTWSGPLTEPGWDPARVGRAFATLMARLGYDRYAAQGGDWGSTITREIGIADPEHVVGVHLNMLIQRPQDLDALEGEERERAAEVHRYLSDGSGYRKIQATRPQTLAYALTDSPVGQLAWIVEKFREWTDPGTGSGLPEDAVDRDRVLADVSAYWFTRTAGSSAQLYLEAAAARRGVVRSEVPTGVAVFPRDIARPIRRLAEEHDRIVRWTEMDRGGHFAALEEPDLLVEDVRAMFRGLR